MNLHVFERTSTIAAVAFAGAGGAVAAATDTYERLSPHEMFAVLAGFVVVLGGALTMAFVRWLGRVEKNVPRDPDRIAESLHEISGRLTRLDEKVDGINVRLGRVEGNLGQLVVMDGDR